MGHFQTTSLYQFDLRAASVSNAARLWGAQTAVETKMGGNDGS